MGTYVYTPQYDADAQEVVRVRTNLRAFRHSDNPLTLFVRTEQGPMDLSGVQSLQAMVINGEGPGWPWDYGLGAPVWRPVLTVAAYSPTPGRVMFTLTAQQLRLLRGGLNTVFIRADDRTISTAFLEVVR